MIRARNMITSSKFFYPKCVDCKYFIKHIENNKEYDDLGKCKKNGYFLPNSRENINFYAISCRKDNKFCGKIGLFFENK